MLWTLVVILIVAGVAGALLPFDPQIKRMLYIVVEAFIVLTLLWAILGRGAPPWCQAP